MNGVEPSERESLFVSDRDGQPFAVLPGVGIAGITGTKAPLVAHEQAGAGGKRLVVYANVKVEEVDDDRLRQMLGQPNP